MVTSNRLAAAGTVAAFLVLLVSGSLAQGTRPGPPYSLLSAEGRRTLATVQAGGQELLRLDELADLFQLTVREDRRSNALTVTRGDRTIVLSLDQGLASIGGRLVSLPTPPVNDGRGWLVPVDFVGRALALVAGTSVDVRKPSRLIVLGSLRVPRVVVRQERAGAQTRLVFDITPRTVPTITHEAGRLLLRFDADAIDASLTQPAGGLVEAIQFADSKTLALDLAPEYASHRATSAPLDGGGARVTLDLSPAGASAPPPAQPRPSPPADAPAAVPAGDWPGLAAGTSPALRTVVIDPGHGGDDTGARGPGGTLEKDVTLDVARKLRSLIEGRLGIRVLLTRDEDRLVPLDERASIANNNKADLFLSLHANASPRSDARGAEVFYVSLDGYEGEAQRQVERPPARQLPALGGGTREIRLTLWEMAQAAHLSESEVLAGFVEEELRRRVEMSARALQPAPLRVLVGANMPAVLVELAFITNADQEERLRSDDFTTTLAQALYDAVLRYRARLQGGTGAAAEPDRGVPARRAPWE